MNLNTEAKAQSMAVRPSKSRRKYIQRELQEVYGMNRWMARRAVWGDTLETSGYRGHSPWHR